MTYVVDVLLLLLIALVIGASLKKGFVSSFLDSFSLIIAGIGAYLCCKPVSDFVYNTFIQDLVKTRFSRILEDVNSSAKLSEKLNAMVGALPQSAVRLSNAAGVNVKTLIASVPRNADKSTEELILAATEKVGKSIMMFLTETVVIVVLFIVFALLVRGISKLISPTIKKIPVVGTVDTVLGAVFGVLKCAVMLCVICAAIYYFGSASDDEVVVTAVQGSRICELWNANNPIISLIQ